MTMDQIWQKLAAHQDSVKGRTILSLFESDDRAAGFSARLGSMLFDYSKTNLDATGRALLLQLAESAGVAAKARGNVCRREDQ